MYIKRISVLLISVVLLASCKSTKTITSSSSTKSTLSKKRSSRNVKSDIVINTAKNYLGTLYKYGGTSGKGIDCSGLVYLSFKEIGLDLPRVSKEQANTGKAVKLSQLTRGDLVFFATGKGRRITHVGIVSKVNNDGQDTTFIHASLSKGVREDKLYSAYWRSHFVKATRVF